MKGRFVVISDLHAHPWAAFASGDGLDNDRLVRTLGVLRASLTRAQQLEVPWVFGGDLVHTAGYALNVVLSALAEEFGRFPDVPKLVVWGNHDARGVGGRIVIEQTIWAALSRAVANLTVLDPSLSQPIVERGGLTFSGVGAQPRPDLLQAPLQSDVGVYHATVRGSKGPNGYVFPSGIEADDLWSRHKIAIVGDLHHPQIWRRAGGGLILVPGSPEHHNFGDATAHGWWVVTADDVPEVEFIQSGSPEFRTVALAQDALADGNFYRVLTRTAGVVLPENATVVAPTPTVVESRTALRGLTGEQILAAWIQEERPIEALSLGAAEDQILSLGRQLLSADDVGQLQNIRLTRIILRNFCSYASAEFRIHDGTWLVLGKGRDYPSNGAGKSTLFEALFWLLFGRTTKGLTGDEVIRWGTKDCRVIAEFVGEDDHWIQATRSRGEASTLTVEEGTGEIGDHWEATSVNEMTEKLTKHLGVTAALFQALGYFSQERMLLFASATDGERKEMLADLIGLSAYQAAASSAQKRLDQLKVDMAGSDGLRLGTEEHLVAQRVTLEQSLARAAEWVVERDKRHLAAAFALSKFEAGVEDAFARLMTEAMSHLSTSNAESMRAQTGYLAEAEAELQKPRVVHTAAELQSARAIAETTRTGMVRAISQVQGIEQQLGGVRIRLAAAEQSLSSGSCPSCGQDIGPEHRQRCLAPLLQEEHALEHSLGMLRLTEQSAIETAAGAKIAADECERGVEAGRDLMKWTQQRDAAKLGLTRLAREAEGIKNVAVAHVTKVMDERRGELQRAIAAVDKEANPHLWSAESAAAQMKETEAKLTARQAEQRRMALDAALYDYWRHGFSKQGIQSLLMDEVAGAFNEARGAIFPALTQGVYDVQLSTLSRTKAGEQRERTEFKVYEHGEIVPYAALSGGQRRRIDVGVMLTLVKAISTWMRVPGALGLLVLDEVFGFLDASGAEGLMEALRDVQMVVPAIYAVSHDPQLQALFSGTVMVAQDDLGVSRIVNGAAREPELIEEASV